MAEAVKTTDKVVETTSKPEVKRAEGPRPQRTNSGSKNVISRQKLLEHGVHFGHKKNRWNPKMKPYIQGIKNDTHIINLDKTVNSLNRAYKALYEITKKGGKVLFVGTKRQVANSVKQNAIRSNSFYINYRWLGGTLTNFNTIKKSIEKYKELERLAKQDFDGYSKKEAIEMKKQLEKYNNTLGGIKYMRHKPSAIILSSSVEDNIALKEAQKLNIPVFAIVDSNSDPDGIKYKIPANDDANKSQALIMTILADAICDAKGLPRKAALVEEEKVEVLGINPRRERPARAPRFNNGRRPERTFTRRPDSRPTTNRDANATAKPAEATAAPKKVEEKTEVKAEAKEAKAE